MKWNMLSFMLGLTSRLNLMITKKYVKIFLSVPTVQSGLIFVSWHSNSLSTSKLNDLIEIYVEGPGLVNFVPIIQFICG